MSWTLIRGGRIFEPQDRGIADLLIVGGRIVAVGADLVSPTGVGEGEVMVARDRIVLPGFIDGHCHVMGASGLAGPMTRTTDLQIERITGCGVTTVVSPLGADSLSRGIAGMLARAAALDAEGITALCYTGGWKHPVPTLTGDPQADVAYVPRIVGIKVAVSEALAPICSTDDLCRLAHAAYIGGRLAGKGAVLHTHIGDHPQGLTPLQEVHNRTGVPIERLVATHVNRNPDLWQQAMTYARAGGSIDLTGMQRPENGHPNAIPAAEAIREALAGGVPAERITLSTDSGASYPRLDEAGGVAGMYMAAPDSLLATVRELVTEGLSWGQAAGFCTAHAADRLGLFLKGRLRPGRDGDVVILTREGDVEAVFAKGKIMVQDGRAVVHGAYVGSDIR